MSRTICISLKDSDKEILTPPMSERISKSEVTDSELEILSEVRGNRSSYSEGYPAPAPRTAEILENHHLVTSPKLRPYPYVAQYVLSTAS